MTNKKQQRIERYETLRKLATDFNIAELKDKTNLSLGRIEFEHGKKDFEQEKVSNIIRQLQRKDYLPLWLNYVPERDKFKWKNNRIIEEFPINVIDFDNLLIKDILLHKALTDSDTRLHVITIEYLLRTNRTSKKLIRSLLKAYLKNINTRLATIYCQALRSSSAVKNWNNSTLSSTKIKRKFKDIAQIAETKQEKMDALFHLVWYCNIIPNASVDTIFNQIEADYPYPYLVKLFKNQKRSRIEYFTLHATAGYGTRTGTILSLLSEFPDNLQCLHTLGVALLNKERDHFARDSGLIIQIWEKLTGITWQGSDLPFITWYHKRKKELESKAKIHVTNN